MCIHFLEDPVFIYYIFICLFIMLLFLSHSRHAHKNKNDDRFVKFRLFDNSIDRQNIDYRFMAGGCHVCFVGYMHAGRWRWCRKRRGLHNTQETQHFRHSYGWSLVTAILPCDSHLCRGGRPICHTWEWILVMSESMRCARNREKENVFYSMSITLSRTALGEMRYTRDRTGRVICSTPS